MVTHTPSTDPDVRHYRIRLLPQVMTPSAPERIRMTDASMRNPPSHVAFHPSPRQMVSLAPAFEHPPPDPTYGHARVTDARAIHRHAVVTDMPEQPPTQIGTLLRKGQCMRCRSSAFTATSFACNRVRIVCRRTVNPSLPGFRTTVRETQEVEGLRLALATGASMPAAKRPKRSRRVLSGCSPDRTARSAFAARRETVPLPPMLEPTTKSSAKRTTTTSPRASAPPLVNPQVERQRGYPERSLPPVGLRYVRATHRLRPVRAPLEPFGEVPQVALQVLAVVLPRLAIHARCRIALERLRSSPTSHVRSSSACVLGLPDVVCLGDGRRRTWDLPVPAQSVSVHAWVSDRAGFLGVLPDDASDVAFRLPPQRRHPGGPIARATGHGFRGSIPSLHVPLSTLRPRPCERRRMTRGRCGWLTLQRTTLSFTTPCRFDRRTEAP